MNKRKTTIGIGIATALAAGALMFWPAPNEPCGFPTPLRKGVNGIAYSGDKIGSQCYQVPANMVAVVVPQPYDFRPCPNTVTSNIGMCVKQMDGKFVALMPSQPGWRYQ